MFRYQWTQQPSYPTQINWNNPIVRNLVYAQSFSDVSHDALSQTNTVTGTKQKTSSYGVGTGFGATSGTGTTDSVVTRLASHATQRTYVFLLSALGSGAGSDFGRLLDKRTVSSQVETFYRDDVMVTINYTRAWSGAAAQWTWPAPTDGMVHLFVLTYDSSSTGNAPVLWMDGVVQTRSVSVTPSGSVLTNTDAYVIGNRITDSARNWSGAIYFVGIFDRIFSAVEVKLINNNPWQIFQP